MDVHDTVAAGGNDVLCGDSCMVCQESSSTPRYDGWPDFKAGGGWSRWRRLAWPGAA